MFESLIIKTLQLLVKDAFHREATEADRAQTSMKNKLMIFKINVHKM